MRTGRRAIWGAKQEQGKLTWNQELATSTLQITGFGADSQGRAPDLRPRRRARSTGSRKTPPQGARALSPKLSETGLFASVAGHRS
jgi:hypothetical protein